MLEIICASSIAFSFNVYQSLQPAVEVLDATRQNVASAQQYLTQSQYRREVDEDSGRHEIDVQDENDGDRDYPDADERRRADENTREEEDTDFDYRREEPRRDNSDEIEDLEAQREALERQIEDLKRQQDSNSNWLGF